MQQSFQITEKEQEKLKFYQQSEQWFIKNLKQAQITVDGQTLDPKIQYMMQQRGDSDKINRVMEKIFATSTGRKFARNLVDREWTLYSKVTPPMQETQDLTVEGRDGHQIPIRIYKPQHAQDENLPILIYAHGGGYLFASIKALDRPVTLIANEAKVMVISIDYRLAPEHPYPAASDDGEDVFLWAKQNAAQFGGDPQRIAFGGDSAGGHIAVNVAQRQIVAGKAPPTMLLLYYPAVGNPMNDRSYQLFGKGYGLDGSFFEYLLAKVFPNKILDDKPDVFMSPLHAPSLKGIPPTILATAGFDILRDSGHKFSKRLKAENVAVTYFNYPSLTHGFLQLSGVIPDAEQATTETAKLLGTQLREIKINK
ncbi:alpha/beta hydrolase [Acinetobacter baumannii]|uniref:alpha/beta hydrolase n=1 Tax=Acinetobacter baumannii TaxID=470 RepID=UPI003FA42220